MNTQAATHGTPPGRWPAAARGLDGVVAASTSPPWHRPAAALDASLLVRSYQAGTISSRQQHFAASMPRLVKNTPWLPTPTKKTSSFHGGNEAHKSREISCIRGARVVIAARSFALRSDLQRENEKGEIAAGGVR